MHTDMKFPVTRESLQAYDSVKEEAEKEEERIQAQLTLLITDLCREFEMQMQSNIIEKKFVWKDLQHKLSMVRCSNLPRFIEKLKETFIGCDVTTDPWKTHIIIDWS